MTDTPAAPSTSASAQRVQRTSPDRIRKLLRRYQIFSYLTCVGLIVLVFVGLPLNRFFDIGIVSAVVGPVHGLIYIIYLACTFDLAVKCGWRPVRTLLVMGAGLIPFATLVGERMIIRRVSDETLTPQAKATNEPVTNNPVTNNPVANNPATNESG